MAKRVRRLGKRRQQAGVPMAPMIDMVFLLLVFFMTASSMSQAGSKVEVELPEAPSSVVPKDLSDRLVVSVDRSGQVFWGGEALELDELRERLAREQERFPGVKLRIRADRATPFTEVKQVMQQAASVGIESYLYAAFQGEEGR